VHRKDGRKEGRKEGKKKGRKEGSKAFCAAAIIISSVPLEWLL
jgi:hypothetical protein